MLKGVVRTGNLWYLVREDESTRELSPCEVDLIYNLLVDWHQELVDIDAAYYDEFEQLVDSFVTHEG